MPLNLHHAGYEDGLHIWEPAEDVVSIWQPGTRYHVDELPPFTIIRLRSTPIRSE